ncbi:ImpE/SciE family protein [Caballeronia sp. LjRoot34]|uniref:type VI secretion system accessory protein TagJ n=1 Tax=Caballeronia sp. LjRoot34 TaxID=3342325 RepID=UPI003ECCB6CC
MTDPTRQTGNVNRDTPLATRLADTEAKVRAYPAQVQHRWELFQLLCVLGQWARAIQQLQVCATQQPDQIAMAHACRDLIRAERSRSRVFAGEQPPGFVFEPLPWMQGLVESIRLSAHGEIEAADHVREAALDNAKTVRVRFPHGEAEWISDSDSRLGPVCEVITAREYRWLPLADIAKWHVERPATLLGLIWAPCTLTLLDGSTVRGFLPARYPMSEDDDDALRLGRRTAWREVGRTAVIGMGQKTWATSAGDFSVFELASCEFTMSGWSESPKDEAHALS